MDQEYKKALTYAIEYFPFPIDRKERLLIEAQSEVPFAYFYEVGGDLPLYRKLINLIIREEWNSASQIYYGIVARVIYKFMVKKGLTSIEISAVALRGLVDPYGRFMFREE